MNFCMNFLIGALFMITLLAPKSSLAKDKEKEISISEVPKEVIVAAQKEIKGIELIEADIITRENSVVTYEIEGKKDKQVYELHITPDGKILEVGLEDEDDAENVDE